MLPVERAILETFKVRVSAKLPLSRLVLFGSRARGDAQADSDMDVLVVLDAPVSAETQDIVSECAWEAGFDHGIVVSPIAVSRQEWEEGPERSSLLALTIQKEGIAV
jgi:predicted nucleotidyltransferase